MAKPGATTNTAGCFVIMSSDPRYDNVYAEAVKPALTGLGLACYRAGDDNTRNIPNRIVREIIQADLVIADVSEPNPNVFYELGVSHALANKTIMISQEIRNLPFDIYSEFTIKYSDDKAGLRLLFFELRNAIERLMASRDLPTNLVQIAGRDFFDLKTKIVSALKTIIEQ